MNEPAPAAETRELARDAKESARETRELACEVKELAREVKELARELVYREAAFLDRREWDAWLSLYAQDAVFWVPAWRDENEPVADPDTEASLIYHTSRAALEDRVWRLRSERSAASTPLLRTAHVVGGVLVEPGPGAETIEAHAGWSCHVFNPKRKQQHVFFGRYEYGLKGAGGELKIARKKILLLNDYIPTMIDFYCL